METLEDTTDSGDKVSFLVTPNLRQEIDRVSQLIGNKSDAIVYSRGFTLLRVVLDAYENGKEVYIQDSTNEKSQIQIPGYNAPESA